jgi:hypothetical protein
VIIRDTDIWKLVVGGTIEYPKHQAPGTTADRASDARNVREKMGFLTGNARTRPG